MFLYNVHVEPCVAQVQPDPINILDGNILHLYMDWNKCTHTQTHTHQQTKQHDRPVLPPHTLDCLFYNLARTLLPLGKYVCFYTVDALSTSSLIRFTYLANDVDLPSSLLRKFVHSLSFSLPSVRFHLWFSLFVTLIFSLSVGSYHPSDVLFFVHTCGGVGSMWCALWALVCVCVCNLVTKKSNECGIE